MSHKTASALSAERMCMHLMECTWNGHVCSCVRHANSVAKPNKNYGNLSRECLSWMDADAASPIWATTRWMVSHPWFMTGFCNVSVFVLALLCLVCCICIFSSSGRATWACVCLIISAHTHSQFQWMLDTAAYTSEQLVVASAVCFFISPSNSWLQCVGHCMRSKSARHV